MNLCGEFVTHKVFGRGKISELENDCLTVLFGKKYGKKRFVYPSALGTFLIPENNMIVTQLKEKSDELARLRMEAQKEAEEIVLKEKLAAKELAKKIKRAAAKANPKAPAKTSVKATAKATAKAAAAKAEENV
jgi:transcription elongation factor GreA-like protein